MCWEQHWPTGCLHWRFWWTSYVSRYRYLKQIYCQLQNCKYWYYLHCFSMFQCIFTGNNGKETISFVLGLKKCRNILTSVNLAKVHQSGNLLKVFGSNLRVGLIFGKILSPLLRFFNDIGYIFIVTKGQYGKINVAIWSHRF